MIYLSYRPALGRQGTQQYPIVIQLVPYNQRSSRFIGRTQPEVRLDLWSLESPFKRLPGLPLPRCNEVQGWCAVCRDPRLEDSFQARACIDDLKEVSAAIVKCGTELTKR